jgi:hypothetical protein
MCRLRLHAKNWFATAVLIHVCALAPTCVYLQSGNKEYVAPGEQLRIKSITFLLNLCNSGDPVDPIVSGSLAAQGALG